MRGTARGGRRDVPASERRETDWEMLGLLEKLPLGRALEFLHKIVDGICGRAYPRYQDYGSIWSLSEWLEVLEETGMYFKTAVGQNISDEEAARQISELNPNYQEAITKCLKGRKEEIRNALVESVNAISSAQLQDFDWQLKLALSSDKISMLQMPLLNLDLDVRENGEIKPISIEMNKEELQNLINALEAANKVAFTDAILCS
ncbi:COMM domain-containing protein 8 isoform X1 [Chroicocephalus ridibundus]|uniref:COMM domain-containing protein 8 isoform X1 n=1 Tax=Chroicocephalus ridibundus TaxID=1192867 RepID=UPI002FDD724B